MAFITYKQYDSRWGNKNYNGSSTMAQGGCGPTACAMILYGVDGKTTPLDTMKYMQTHGDSTHKKFALYGQGTAWNGITQCLKDGGLKDVQVVTSMSKAFELLSEGYVGLFRFQPGSRGGVTWTTEGHYIAVTGYKVKNGKHYLYTRDSGSRNHTGWYCYETTMKGLLSDPAIWLGTTKTVKKSYKHCIDTSFWQGTHSVADWKEVRKSCTYAIHRASYTSQSSFSLGVDSTFQTNFKNAKAAGFKCGAYHYSQAKTVEEAKKEAEFLCKQLKGLDVDFYVVCDYEFGGRLNSNTAGKANEVVNAFCDVVKSHGYSPCIYANTSTLNKYVTKPKYPVWVAQYASKCTYSGSKVMWQYTSSGKVSGISGKVDLSLVYSAPSTSKPTTPTTTKKSYSGSYPDFTELSGEIIAQTAKELAWPLGTDSSKYKYPKGRATEAFMKAINKVYPNRSSWSAQCQAGASCDVGIGTVLRYCGAFPDISRGLSGQFPELKNSKKFKDVGLKNTSEFKPGDIGMYKNKTKGAHIWTTLGGTKVVESNHTAKYCLHRVTKNITNKNRKEFHCYRMTKPIRSYLKKGDEGEQVKRWQKYLKWYGFDCSVDGKFGDKTLGFTKTFQYENKLTADGIVGAKTITKAKEIKK